jgi:hypothetical protein
MPKRVAPTFEYWTWKTQWKRFTVTLKTAVKVFLGAFLWEGFGLACGCSIYSDSYYFSTGAGMAIGSFIGHLLIMYTTQLGRFEQGNCIFVFNYFSVLTYFVLQ